MGWNGFGTRPVVEASFGSRVVAGADQLWCVCRLRPGVVGLVTARSGVWRVQVEPGRAGARALVANLPKATLMSSAGGLDVFCDTSVIQQGFRTAQVKPPTCILRLVLGVLYGADCRTRTCDPLITNQWIDGAAHD